MKTSSETGNHMQSWAWICVFLSPEVQGGREEDQWVLPVTVLAEKHTKLQAQGETLIGSKVGSDGAGHQTPPLASAHENMHTHNFKVQSLKSLHVIFSYSLAFQTTSFNTQKNGPQSSRFKTGKIPMQECLLTQARVHITVPCT